MPHVCTSDCVKGVFSFLMETHNLFCYSRACLLFFFTVLLRNKNAELLEIPTETPFPTSTKKTIEMNKL
jgi:hypothetical protein